MKKHWKSSLTCLLLAMCCLCMAACGNAAPVSSEEASTGSEEASVSSQAESEAEVSSQASSSTSSKATSSGKNPTAGTNSTASRPTGEGLNVTPDSEANMFPSKWTPTSSVSEIPANLKANVKSGTISILTNVKYNDETTKALSDTFKKLTGQTLKINYNIVEWNSLRSQLLTLVLAKKGPDVFGPVYNGVAIYLRNKNLARNLNDYINMNDAAFSEMKAYDGVMYYKGKLTGTTVDRPDITSGIMYNKSLIEQAGLENPYQLFQKGQWTMDTFMDYAEKLTVVKNNTTSQYGYSGIFYDFFKMALATGEDLVKIRSDGSVVSNMSNSVFTRYASYARKMSTIKSVDPLCIVQNNVLNGTAAMRATSWTELYTDSKAKDMHKQGRIGWVPNPRDPSSSTYYHNAEQYYYLLPESSSNPWGGAAFIYAARYNNVNKDTAKEKAKFMNEYGFSAAEYQFFTSDIYKKLTPKTSNYQHIPDFDYMQLEQIYKTDWSVVKEKLEPVLKKALVQANK